MTILFPYMARWNSANMSRYYHLFRKIADAGHTVIVLQPPPRSSEETNYIDLPMQSHPNIVLITLEMNEWLWNVRFPVDKFFKKALYTIGSAPMLRKLAWERKADVLVLYNLPQYIYTLGTDIPVVFDYADDYMAMFQHELGISKSNVFYRISNGTLQRLIDRSVLVSCVSRFLQEKIRHRNVLLLPNGADVQQRPHEPTILHIDKTKPVVGYVGAFEYFIDLKMMLATAELMPDCTFLYVGAGREFAQTKEEVARRRLDNVILTGAVPHHQAMQFIAEMDICLNLFTKGDVSDGASPIKLFEYLANRKPVITTRLPEALRLDPAGEALFYAGTLEETIGQIRQILGNPDQKEAHIAKGVNIVECGHTWGALAEIFVKEMEKAIRQGAAA